MHHQFVCSFTPSSLIAKKLKFQLLTKSLIKGLYYCTMSNQTKLLERLLGHYNLNPLQIKAFLQTDLTSKSDILKNLQLAGVKQYDIQRACENIEKTMNTGDVKEVLLELQKAIKAGKGKTLTTLLEKHQHLMIVAKTEEKMELFSFAMQADGKNNHEIWLVLLQYIDPTGPFKALFIMIAFRNGLIVKALNMHMYEVASILLVDHRVVRELKGVKGQIAIHDFSDAKKSKFAKPQSSCFFDYWSI